MSRASASLPNVVRRSISTPSLERGHAKHPLRSTVGSGRVARARSGTTVLPKLVAPLESVAEAAGGREDPLAEVCSICLEGLHEGVFTFPCGRDHRLHCQCAVHFLGSVLSMALHDGAPGPLPPRVARDMGAGYRAVGLIEDAIRRATPQTLCHMGCPLCRREWPPEEQRPLHAVMAQLREASAARHRSSAERLAQGLQRVRHRLDHGEAEQCARAARGLAALRQKRHDASSFLAHRTPGDGPAAALLRFLPQAEVSHLSQAARAGVRVCRDGRLLRAPHVKLTRVRVAAHHVSAPGLLSLQVNAGGASPCARGSVTGMDAVAFAKWLGEGEGVLDITMHGVQWERVDPGGVLLEGALARKRLRSLELSHNCLGDASVARLAGALLASSGALEALILDLNCVGAAGLRALLPLGGPGRGVRRWGFRHNALADEGCRAIAEAGPGAAAWDLRTNRITARGCRALAPVVEGMVVARLGCNALGDAGLAHLAPGIGEGLQVLDLRQAHFGDAGAQELARALLGAADLRELLLSGNDIRSEGARALAEAWRWLLELRHVDLSNNALGDGGLDHLADELPLWRQSPLRLSLIGTGCGERGAAALRAALEENPRHDWQWLIELQNNDPGTVEHAAAISGMLDPGRWVAEGGPSELL